jgi:exonuclease VII small subunit
MFSKPNTSSFVTVFCRVESLVQSMNSGRETLDIVQNLTEEGINLLDQVVQEQAFAGGEVERLLDEANQLCPRVREFICTNLTSSSTCNLEGLEDEILNGTILLNLLDQLESGRSVVSKEVEHASRDLEDILSFAENVDNKAETCNWAFQVAGAFSLLLALLSLLIIHGVASFRITRVVKCLESWILIPVFVL